ncbi:unnamed protein product [Prunus armeniaca]|uniref:Uncharacterized protein n=1 Tax=Prunus armeniaca TaxID=36596 RepID=A0A6J5X4G2_PRUAR|nr:unnamed protein product [Prunus armeniaca]CAB4308906.1 unnamed protein product [Prunus armeniaca]
MSPEKRAGNPGSWLAKSLRRALEEQREAEQRKGCGGGKVGQPTIPIDGDPGPLRVIPPSTPSSQPTIVLDGDGSTEKDKEVDTTGMVPRIREFCVGKLNKLRLNPYQLERELGTLRFVLYQPGHELGMARWVLSQLDHELGELRSVPCQSDHELGELRYVLPQPDHEHGMAR